MPGMYTLGTKLCLKLNGNVEHNYFQQEAKKKKKKRTTSSSEYIQYQLCRLGIRKNN